MPVPPASTSVGSPPSRGTLTRAFVVAIATASVFSDACCRTALSAPGISVRMPPGEVTTPAERSSTTGVRPTAVIVGFADASSSPTDAAEASRASPSLSTGTVTTSPRSGASPNTVPSLATATSAPAPSSAAGSFTSASKDETPWAGTTQSSPVF